MVSINGEVYNRYKYEKSFLQHFEEDFDLTNGSGSFSFFIRNKDELENTLGARMMPLPKVYVSNSAIDSFGLGFGTVVEGSGKKISDEYIHVNNIIKSVSIKTIEHTKDREREKYIDNEMGEDIEIEGRIYSAAKMEINVEVDISENNTTLYSKELGKKLELKNLRIRVEAYEDKGKKCPFFKKMRNTNYYDIEIESKSSVEREITYCAYHGDSSLSWNGKVKIYLVYDAEYTYERSVSNKFIEFSKVKLFDEIDYALEEPCLLKEFKTFYGTWSTFVPKDVRIKKDFEESNYSSPIIQELINYIVGYVGFGYSEASTINSISHRIIDVSNNNYNRSFEPLDDDDMIHYYYKVSTVCHCYKSVVDVRINAGHVSYIVKILAHISFGYSYFKDLELRCKVKYPNFSITESDAKKLALKSWKNGMTMHETVFETNTDYSLCAVGVVGGGKLKYIDPKTLYRLRISFPKLKKKYDKNSNISWDCIAIYDGPIDINLMPTDEIIMNISDNPPTFDFDAIVNTADDVDSLNVGSRIEQIVILEQKESPKTLKVCRNYERYDLLLNDKKEAN